MHPNRKKPPAAGLGRPKGAKNKITKAVKDSLEEALNAGKGAVDFWIKLKRDDPRTFAIIASKLIPHQIQAEMEANVNHSISYKLEYKNPEEESIEVTADETNKH